MRPILFAEDETNFNHNGIGVLDEALTSEVTEVTNGEFEVIIDYPVSGRWFKEIKNMMIVRVKPNAKDDDHNFRIYDIDKTTSTKTITIYAHSITNDLGGNLVKSVKVDNKTAQEALNLLKNSLVEKTDITFQSDITTRSSTEWTMQNPLNAIVGSEGSMVQYWGGEIKRTDRILYLMSRRGTDRVTTIRPQKGMTGLTMKTSTKGIITRILPYFVLRDQEKDTEQTIVGTIVASPLAGNYPIDNLVPVDYGQDDEIKTLAQLNAAAKTYFTTQNPGCDKPDVEINVDLLQLADTPFYSEFKNMEAIGLTDTISVYVPKYDVDVEVKVNELVYNSLSEKTISITAGDISGTFYESSKKDYDKTISALQQYVAKTENGLRNYVQISANGKNKVFRGYTEPDISLAIEGDLWFKEIGNGEQEIWIFDGAYWQPLMTAGINAETQAALDLAQQALDKANEDLKAVEDAMVDVNAAMQDLETAMATTAQAAADAKTAAADAQIAADDASAVGKAAQEAGDQALSLVDQAQKDIDLANETIGAHTIDLSKLFSDFASMDTIVDGIVIDTGTMKTAISENDAAIKSVKSTTDQAIAENAADILTAQQLAESAKSKADAVEATTHTITQDLTTVTETITTIEETATSTTKTLNEVKSTVDGQVQTIATVKSTADSALSKSNTNSTTIDGIQTTLTSTKTTADSALTKANSAQSTADGNTTKITSAQTTATNALTKANTVEQTVDGQKTTITSIQNDLANVSQGSRNLLRNSSMYENTTGWSISPDLNGVIKDGYLLLDKTATTTYRLNLSYNAGNQLINDIEPDTEYSLGFAYYVESVSQTGDSNNVFLRTQYGTASLYDLPIYNFDFSETGVWKWAVANGPTQSNSISAATFTLALGQRTIARIRVKEFILVKGKNVKEWLPSPIDLATTIKVNQISDTVDGHTQLIASTKTTADSALTKANSAQSTADGNTTMISSVSSTADSALSKANSAQSTADGNTTKITATTTTANTALSTANTAKSTADGNSTKIASVTTTANSALSKANTAQSTADGNTTKITAVTKTADSALSKATSVETTANGLTSKVTAVETTLANSGNPNLLPYGGGNPKAIHGWSSSVGLGLATHVYYKTGMSNLYYLTNPTTSERTASSARFTVKPDTQYTFKLTGFASSNVSSMDIWWLSRSKGSSASYDRTKVLVSGRRLSPSKAEEVSVTFTTYAADSEGYIRIDNNGSTNGSDANIFFIDVMMVEGPIAPKEWSPSYIELATASQFTQLSDQIDLRVEKAGVISAINVSTEGVIIAGNKITITGVTKIDNAVIKTAHIADANISTAKIADLAVSNGKIANLAVTEGKIGNLAVTNAKIGALAVDSAKLANASVIEAKIGSAAVTTAKIGDLAVTTAKIGNLAVTDAKIANATITAASIQDAAIISAKIADLAVTGAKIADATITSAKIISLDAGKITANSLSAIVTNTGTLNVSGYLNINNPDTGIYGGYDYGDSVSGSYNPRWYTGSWRIGTNLYRHTSEIYSLTSSGSKGTRQGYFETSYGSDYMAMRKYDTSTALNMSARVDINSDRIQVSNSWNETSGVILSANGEMSASEVRSRGAAYLQSTLDVAGDTYLRSSVDMSGSLITRSTVDMQGSVITRSKFEFQGSLWLTGNSYINSMPTYNRTTSAAANLMVTSNGYFARSTSAKKYKIDIQVATGVIDKAKSILAIDPVSWIDRSEAERGISKQRYYGFIADVFDNSGLTEVVTYGDGGQVEGLAYDRISMYHNVILREHEIEINNLKSIVNQLLGGTTNE